ncbi:MAG: sigma-70 family RNA polymerase sigma factor [Candidatus Aminicenantes bacterium]|nr:sigma-70 family RNA polymerase sigma factor [Candidatus Aminicenantes bacterium]
MEEHELVRRSQDGDREAFTALVRNYQAKVHSLAYGFTRNDAQADDLAQDIFLKAWLGLSKFRFRSGFGTWLYRIAVNHVKDHLRKRASSREIPLQEDSVRAASRTAPPADREAGEKERRAELVRDCLAGLPEKFRMILTLRDVQGLSYEDLSRTLRLSAGTVDSRLFRARKMLRRRVESRISGERRSP